MGRSVLSPRDLVAEATAGVVQRPARSALTALGTVLGVGAFIAVLGLTGTAAAQIGARFDRLKATEVTVEDTGGQDAADVALSFTSDADARVDRLNGVRAAGVFWRVRLGADQPVRSVPLGAGGGTDAQTQVIAASPACWPPPSRGSRRGGLMTPSMSVTASRSPCSAGPRPSAWASPLCGRTRRCSSAACRSP